MTQPDATLRFAVIGRPITQSLSPAMHGVALRTLGLDARYDARDVSSSQLHEIIDELRGARLHGVNVTAPHKLAVAALCDRLDDDAQTLGAVNTVLLEGGQIVGANTDVAGLYASLASHADTLRRGHVVVLGAGGAARAAIAVAHRLEAREITLVARDPEKAPRVPHIDAVRLDDRARLSRAFASASLLVQATSATMGPHASAFVALLPLEALPPTAIVTDLVYRPRRTQLLEACRRRGLETIDGTEMLVRQGAASLARWLGRPLSEMPIAAMRDAVLAACDPAMR